MAAPWRIFWLLVLGFHAVAAAGWLWLAPGGFPAGHPRFLSNRVIPWAVLSAVGAAVWAARAERTTVLRMTLAAFPAGWVAGSIGARFAFPITLAWLFAAPTLGGLSMAAAYMATFWKQGDGRRGPILGAALGGCVLGSILPLTIVPPQADTRPLNAPTPPPIAGLPALQGGLRDGGFVSFGDGSTSIKTSPLTMTIQPLLRFISRSPDGAPTILVPTSVREGRGLRLIGAEAIPDGFDLRYRSDFEASLRVEAPADAPVHLEAFAEVPATIWSHLNSFCDIDVSGHRSLSLSFSPCGDRKIEVLPAQYPSGRPLRFAFLDDAGRFRVVEAASGEKGPFRELASGPLGRGQALAITLHDAGKPIARITLEDWSAQAGTGLSPTAGWGAPVNAIEFQLAGEDPRSAASIYVTLAGTSVGRGWDCVGHGRGTYRNRVRVERLGGGS